MKTFLKEQNKNGFGIVEVIVAVGIITVGIIPIIMLFNKNLESEIKNKNVLIAAYLANESIEIIRQERDNNWIAGFDWMGEGQANPIPVNGSEAIISLIDSSNIKKGWNIKTPANDDRKKIYLNSDGVYVQSNNSVVTWEETSFERYLTINEGAAGCFGAGGSCVRITSHVWFGGAQIAEVTTYLYDGWK